MDVTGGIASIYINIFSQKEGRLTFDALPHEDAFLSLCSFFIVPRSHIKHNRFRINIGSIERGKYAKYHVWGYDEERCRTVWQEALKTTRGV